MITIISPVYRAENLVSELVKRVVEGLKNIPMDYEVILVEDGSPDDSWSKIKEECEKNEKVKGVKLSRNFGQHYAITAGLKLAKGDWVVVMDCDLQDRPEEIENLYHEAMKGNDIVFARRVLRNDGFFKKLSSKVFYMVFGFLTDTKQDSSIANFGIYSRKVVDAILSMKDYIRYFPTMSQWVGFNKSYYDVEHSEREEGASSYSWKRLLNLAYNNIIAFSDKPLRLTIKLGLMVSIVSGLIGCYYLYQYYVGRISVSGFTSLIISIWFLSGLIIFTLGVIGVYIGKMFEQVKDRPTYIEQERINF